MKRTTRRTVFIRKRHLLFWVAACAILFVANARTRRMTPAQPEISVATEGSFQRDGQYPGEAFANTVGVLAWGSWSGSDENVGTLTLGPFPAPRILRFGIGGYPNNPDNALRVELVETGERLAIESGPIGERWRVVDFELPVHWIKRPIRIVATDDSKDLGGWLSITEPLRGGRGDGNNALIDTFVTWMINGLLLGLMWLAAAQQLSRRLWSRGVPAPDGDQNAAQGPGTQGLPGLAPHWIPLGAAAIVAACGYVTFWAYFANALFGVIVSWVMLAAGVIGAMWPVIGYALQSRWSAMPPSGWFGRGRPRSKPDADIALHRPEDFRADRPVVRQEVATVMKLMVAVGAFHLTMLHLFPSSHDFYTLAANRFRDALPIDNALPHTSAERLFASASLKNATDEWLSSDRPPLQSGWQLLTWPVSKLLHLDRRTASGTSAVWFQLLWVAAGYGLLRTFSLERARAVGWVAALALCGFFLQNTTFTWPKLSAAAFACGAFSMLFLPAPGSSPRSNASWAALFAGLAWLSHGGVAFSFLPLLPVLAWRAGRGAWRPWLPGAAIFLALVLPWLAFQKIYDPPANRLFKWHLAGQTEKDARGTWETIRDGYAKIGWREAWLNKASNFHAQVFGNWSYLLDPSAANAAERRNQEFFHSGRALTWWPVLTLFAVVVTRRRMLAPARDLLTLIAWVALTIIVWCLLMFGRYTAVIHHGSYATMIGLFVIFSVLLERAGRGWLPCIAVLQAISLGTTWAVSNLTIHGPATGLPFVIISGAVLGWFVVKATITTSLDAAAGVTQPQSEDLSEPASSPGPLQAIRAWWRNPRINLWVLGTLALLLAMRKPHALFTPQLWAEDGSIFLMQADLIGPRAIITPYMGYLHLLPRLIAQAAPRLLDPAWWPAFYNGVAFVLWVALLGRFFSRRFDFPGKPWLVLAFFLGPNTGEVLFNITNLQWLTAFGLLQQVLIAAPTTRTQRIGDLLIITAVALTGPFAIVFVPLFAWRAWRDRRPDNIAVLLLVAACAAVQAWFVVRTSPKFDYQAAPFHFFDAATVLARRLVVWPVFGDHFAFTLPKVAIASVGMLVIAAVVIWALRPHPLRRIRGPIVAAFGLIVIASVFRTRPDTWESDNLFFGDRYFYIPRVLLAWLLIWEFHAAPRFVANIARVLCFAALVVHLPDYRVPPPRDLRWADHCDPIRRGVRADIPILPDGWTLEYRGRPAPHAAR